MMEVAAVVHQTMFEDVDRWQEVVPLDHHQVDVVVVCAAAKAMGQVVFGVHGRAKFLAPGTLETEVAIAFR